MWGWLDRPGYFKGVENFSDGVRVFWEIENFQVGRGLRLFHNGWGNFRVVEIFTRSDVFPFSCRLRFSSFFDGGGREGWYFSRSLRFLMGVIPSNLSFLSGCSRFFRWWPGGGVIFFLEVIQFLGGRIHLKINILSWRSFIMHTPKRPKLPSKIVFEEAPVHIASPKQCHIYVI